MRARGAQRRDHSDDRRHLRPEEDHSESESECRVRIVPGTRRLVEVLAEWGLHEAEGRLRGKLPEPFIPPASGPARSAAGVELALRYRSPLVGRILSAGPAAVLSVECGPDDREGLFIADGRPLSEWAVAISTQ